MFYIGNFKTVEIVDRARWPLISTILRGGEQPEGGTRPVFTFWISGSRDPSAETGCHSGWHALTGKQCAAVPRRARMQGA